MIDIEDTAARAIESPIAPPPDLAHVETLAARYRRRRAALGTTTGVTLIALIVAIGIALLAPQGNSGVDPEASGSTPHVDTTASSPGVTATAPDLTIDGLVARLAKAHRVVKEGTNSGSPLAAEAHLLCVDGTPVHVYEYPDRAARAAVSDTISRDGSRLERPDSPERTSETIIDWVGPPHFFASGRVIVLVLTDDRPLLRWLTDTAGPTLSPEAHPGPTHDVCNQSATPSSTGP